MRQFLKSIINAIAESRQASANYEIARLLQRTEYPNESIERILNGVTKRDFGDLK